MFSEFLKSKKLIKRRTMLAAFAAAGVACAGYTSSASAAELEYGEIGDPVNLVVGYQPYYTEAWSGVVMKGLKLYEKYLPEGSTVEFQIGLQGGIIVNAMLAGKQHIGYMGDMPAIVAGRLVGGKANRKGAKAITGKPTARTNELVECRV